MSQRQVGRSPWTGAKVIATKLGIDEAWQVLYQDLRGVARQAMAKESVAHTLSPTALVNEVYCRLKGDDDNWRSASHWLALGRRAMSQELIDHARRHAAKKRGSNTRPEWLDESTIGTPDSATSDETLVVLALNRLRTFHEEPAYVTFLLYFVGITVSQISELLDVSERTVKRRLVFARAWLLRELSDGLNASSR